MIESVYIYESTFLMVPNKNDSMYARYTTRIPLQPHRHSISHDARGPS
jgi:hypothetical protein